MNLGFPSALIKEDGGDFFGRFDSESLLTDWEEQTKMIKNKKANTLILMIMIPLMRGFKLKT